MALHRVAPGRVGAHKIRLEGVWCGSFTNRENIVNFDKKYYLVLAVGYAIIWMCVGILATMSQNIADSLKQWLHWFRKKKSLR